MIFLGSDHGGFTLKQKVAEFLKSKGHETTDVGCLSSESCDYPIFGAEVGKRVVAEQGSLGIVVCGSGVGISIAANKVKGIRCVLANSMELAKLGREHNHANVLAMGERTEFIDDPLDIVETFLDTKPDMDTRHVRRVELLNNYEL